MDTIGERVKTRRESAGIAQAELAKRVGTNKQTLSAIEGGATKAPGADLALRLARELGVSPWWLVLGEGRPEDASSQPPRPNRAILLDAIQITENVLARLQITYPPKQRADLIMGSYLALEAGHLAEAAQDIVSALLEAQTITR